MSFLLDTCVLSEMIKLKPEKAVSTWFSSQKSDALYVSALTLGELQKGIAKLEVSARKAYLEQYLHTEIIDGFEGRILNVDSAVALSWGNLVAKAEKSGKPMPYIDSLIAATAIFHNLTLVTRNTKDVEASGVELFNPWAL
jgi:predicted nucleic acid-binding protein